MAEQFARCDTLFMKGQRRKTFLREWRQHKGLTLEGVAPRAGTSHPNLSKIERGLVPYDQDLLEKLASIYGCDEVDLLVRDPAGPIDIRSVMDRASPSVRAQIVRVAETLVGSSGAETP